MCLKKTPLILGSLALLAACTSAPQDMTDNPLVAPSTLPHEATPFDKIKIEHYLPAIEAGIREQEKEIADIIHNPEPPTYENTIEALERSGSLLQHVTNVFYALLECVGTDEMHHISEEIQPLVSQHSLNISLNERLFKRVEQVWNNYKGDTLSEHYRLLKTTYEDYVRSGATLKGEARTRYREIQTELDSLSLLFGQNVQYATAAFSLTLNPETDLEGLPAFVREALKEQDYKLGLVATDYGPFMQYSSRRDLREKLYKAYNTRCTSGPYDNTPIIRQLVLLRREKAALLGYRSFADFQLENKMAHTPEAVNKLLGDLLVAYRPAAENDVKAIADYAKQHDGLTDLQPWDFSYYAERLKDERYSVNDAQVKPYLALEKVKAGVFGLATRLYGLQFRKLQVPVYHPEVECYEVLDAGRSYLGLLYVDFFPRDTKRPGAWMTSFKEQWIDEKGIDSRPHVSIVMSFSKPIGKSGDDNYVPALLTYDEVSTFLHEFGHALHGLVTRCHYKSLSGTNVAHDFVELPSQFNENFLREKEFMDTFAADYRTGEPIPQELLDRLQKASNYLAGYRCLRQLSFGMLDMSYHSLGRDLPLAAQTPADVKPSFPALNDLEQFEMTAMEPTSVMPHVAGTFMAPTFTHLFSGGYAAGYYGYKWAEVLDADAFGVFQKEGIFNPATAARFHHLLESGDTVDPAQLYREFKGSDPDITAIMRRDGIVK